MKSLTSVVYKIVTVFMIAMLVLTAMPVTPASAASTANMYPTLSANVAGQTNWGARDSGRLSDDARATAGGNAYMTVSGFGFAIPAGAVITGVEVNIEAYSTNGLLGQKNVTVSISPDGGATWAPNTYTTSGLRTSAPDSNYLAGGPLTNWGRTWTVAEINSANFMVRLVTNNPVLTGTFNLDSVYVRVTYTVSSTTALTSSLNPSNVGDSVTFTATVTGTAGTPTGNMTFRDGATVLGTVALDASGVATYTTIALTGGSHSITATYNGNATYATSNAALTQGVNQVPAITSANAATFTVGTPGTFTVVTSGFPTPTLVRTGDALPAGVNFNAATGVLNGAPASGTVGVYNFVFTATNTSGPDAVQNFTLTVNKGNQTINFPAPASPAGFGTTFNINATATSGLPVTVVATGVCTLAGNTVTMTSGTGICTLTANQAGDDSYNAAPTVIRTVNAVRATTTVTITSSANPSVLGQTVVFTVRVTSPGGTPTGTVTLTDTFGQVLGTTQTLVGGIATFNINTLTVYRVAGIILPHIITATYNGDANFAGNDATINQTVGTANTITTITSSINPSALGQSVTFTSTTVVAPPGAGIVAGGTVTFYDGAVSLGTGTANASGVATFTTAGLAMGSHNITAYYQGTNDYGTSTSPILVQVVRRPSTTTLTSSLNPSTYGDPVTFTATVTGPALTPTGTVTFYDGTTPLGPASPLNGTAVATLNIATLTAGSHNITARYSGDTNFVPGTSAILIQNVNPAPLTVTANNLTNIYGDSEPVFTFTYTGFVLGETLATSDVTGSPACSTTVTPLTPVGAYPITCTVGTLISNNYSFNIVDGTLTVNPKPLTITADNQGKVYGFLLTFNGTEFTTNGLINTDTVTSVTLTSGGTPANAPAGTYPIVPTAAVGTGLANYTINYVNGTLTVGGNVLVIAANDWVGPNAKTYGDVVTFNGTEFTVVSGLQPGDSVTSVTLTSPGAAANAVVGTHPIVASAAVGIGLNNYIIVYTNGQMNVNPRPMTFNPNDETKVYGSLFTSYTGTFTGLMGFDNITPNYDSAGAVETALVGTYDITVTLNDPGNRLGNYTYTIDPAPTATLTVTPRALIVTPDNKTKVYGDVFNTFTGTIAGIQNGDNITATYASTGTPAAAAVGGHPIIATLVDPDGMLSNYTVTNNQGTLTVTQRALIVISDSQSKIYGDVFTTFTGSFIGIQNGDDITATYASAGALASATFGTYPITTTLIDPDSKLGNYSVTYNNGTLTVMRRTLVVTPSDQTKIYGDTFVFTALSGTVTGLQAGDNITPVYSSSGAIATATVGTYPITVTLSDPGGRLGNYDFTLNTGTLTVTKRDLVVTSDDKYKDYGTWFIAFTGSINGIQNGENITANYASAGSPPAAAVGPYPITITLNDPTGKLGNYNVILNQGTLTVGSSVLTVTAFNQTIPYGSPDPAFTFSYSGFAAGDTPAVIDTPPTCTVAGAHTDIGTYSIVCSGGVDNAYTFVYVPGTLTVTKRNLVVTPADKIKIYGSVFNAFTGTITGIQNGENITATYSSLGAPATAPVGTYDINALLVDPDGKLANYNVVLNIGTLTVDPRTLVVSPNNQTKIYGDIFSAYTATINGLQNADTVIVNYTSAGEVATATVGTYPITVTLTDPGNILSNYTVTLNTATLTVTRRPLIVTPDNKAKIFGVDFTAFTGTVVGLQAGDIITETYASPGAPAAAPAGSYPITVTLSDPGNKLPNYLVTLNTGILNVGVNVLTVTAENKTKIYGDPDPAFTFTYAGFQGTDTPAVLTTQPTCQVSVAHNSVGTFPITCAGGVDENYVFTYTPGTLTINPRAVVVTPDNKTKVYGDTFTAFTGTVTGLQARDNITVTYASTGAPATATVAGSPYPIVATLVDPDNRLSNYTVTLNTGLLTVTQRTLIVTPDNKNKIYGSVFNAFTGAIVGLQGGDSVVATYASAGSPATAAIGTYPITVTLGDPGGILSNYAVTLNTGTLTVTVRDLVVTPADKTKIYGDVFSAFTGAIVGIQNGDPITATYASTGAPSPAPIGTYDITATLNAAPAVLANYNITYNLGTLTVTQRLLIVTPDDKGKAFGIDFTAFTGTVVGLRAGDNITPIYASTGAPAAAPAGTYPITVTLTDPDNLLPNYIVTLRTGTLTVGANVLTVTASDQTIIYGNPDPVFTFTYAGFQAGDTPAVLTTQPTCQVTVAHNAVGTYPITCSGGVDDNYVFSYTPGTLTVTARTLVVTPANKSKIYGDTFTAFTGTVTGALGADSITVTYDSNGAPAAAIVGTYPINATLTDPFNRLSNYTVTLNTGTLTVTQRTLIATPDDKNKVYGTVFTAFTGTIAGLQNGDNITATYASAGAIATAAVGPYPITVTLVDPGNQLPNYAVTLNTGTLTVTGNVLIVTPADKVKTYGDLFTAFTGTVIGVQPGDNITATYSSTGAAANAAIGTYDITVTLNDPLNRLPNYSNVILNIGTLTVNPRALVVTPDNKAKVFGTLFNAFTGTVTGVQAGDNITATYASTGAPVIAPVGSYPITATLNDPLNRLSNYTVTLNTGTLTVGLTILTVTADDQTKVYGDADPLFTFAYAGFTPGDTPAVLTTQPTCQVLPPHNAIGTYPITCSGGIDENYSFSYVAGTLTVTARPLTVTPDAQTKIYGDVFTAFTGTVTGLQASDNITVTYSSTGAPAIATVGTYPITAALTDPGNRLGNYTVTLNTANLLVTPRSLVATSDDKNKAYGVLFTAFTGSVVGIQNGDVITATYSSIGAPAAAATGNYPIAIALNDPGNKLANYTLTYNIGTLTVGQYTLVVTPDNNSKVYGDVFTAFTGAMVGLQPGDNITVTYASTGAAANAVVGTYPITATLNDPDGKLVNYTVTLNTGTLTVTPRALTVTPDNKAKVFGTVFNAFTGTVTGAQAGDNITVTYNSPGALAAAAVGTYNITATLNDPNNRLSNYTVTLNTGTLTVGNTVLTVTANNQTIIYGAADPVFTFTYAGFINGDTAAVLTTEPTCQVTVAHNAVGTFPITCSGGVDDNYIFSYVPATLTVTSRALTVTPNNQTKVYGDVFTAFTGATTGIQGADNITVTYASAGAAATATVGTYPITATLNDPDNRLGNYTVTLNTANLVVTQRPLIATPDDKNKVYGVLFTAFTGTVTGIQNGDAITPVYASTGAPAAAAAGIYDITVTLNATPAVLANYAITLNIGTLTVGGNTLIVTAADKTKVYGDVFTAFTGTVVGLQPGDVITATYASPGAAANAVVGDHNITVTLNDPGNKLPNYTVIINTGTLTVTPRALTVTPDNKAKVFGTVFNAFTGTVTGVQAGDNIAPVYASTGAPAAAAVGSYPITVTLNDPGNRLSNYTVTLNTGTLTVGNTVLTVTANNQTIVYGTPDPVFTFNYAGFVGGDTPADIDTPPTCQVLPAHNAIGAFPITCAGGVDNSYVFTYVAGTLTVTPRPLAITPDDKSKVYGDIFTAFTGVINGIQGSDNITATYASIGAPGISAVGTYPITVAVINDPGNRLGNYTVTRNTGTLTVTQRALTVTSADKIKFYGNLFTAFTGTITGIQNGDNITATYASTGGPLAAIVGDYPITITLNDAGGRLPNYTVTTNEGTLTVTPRDLVVNGADKVKSYGSVVTNFTGTMVGIKNADGITATYDSTGAPATAPVGIYPINITLVDPNNKLGNYDVSLNPGTLTVAVNSQTITIMIPAPATAGFNTGFTVAATASSGLPVVYSAGGTACTNVGATFTMTANTGVCIVQYDQPGDANYPPAPQLTQTVATQKASQIITVTTSAPLTALNGTSFPVAATSSSGLPVNIVTNGNCFGNGSDSTTINMATGTGICTIIYSQAGDSNYLAATSITEIVSATNAPVVILQPVDAWVLPGATATFVATATGNPSPTVQWQVSTNGGTTFTDIPGATATTFSITAQLPDNGDQYRAIFTNTEGTATTTPAVLHVDNISPRVTKINSVADTGDARLDETETADVAVTQLLVTFNEDLGNPIGNIGKDDVTNPANYLLVRDNGDGIQTTTCSAGVLGGDVEVAVDLASFNNRGGSGPYIANLYLNGGVALRNGIYRLIVCGTTSITDLAGNKLAGDGTTAGTDFTRNFIVNVPSNDNNNNNNNNNNIVQPSGGLLIPVTGFKQGEVTVLPKQPATMAYAATDLWLEIPKLKLKMTIVGVPQTKSGWDISWLGRNAGWLNGSAFPTWKGNSVITAHVWDELNKPGPFVGLINLQYGDQVIVHAFGYVYTYEVTGSSLILPTNTSAAFKHEDKSWLTLITCEDYKEATQTYKSRRMVRALLVSVTKEK